MGKIYMIGAMKGGVGKSVSVFNLAYSLQKCGKKVLAVDFDPQANLTTCFGAEDVDVAIGDLMMSMIEEEELPAREEYIWERNGVDFIPASIQLSAVDAKLRLEMGTEKMLASILEPLREDYDYILIDTCPSLGALNINAMAAADEVIVTVNPQLLAMMGLQDFLKTEEDQESHQREVECGRDPSHHVRCQDNSLQDYNRAGAGDVSGTDPDIQEQDPEYSEGW